ncbi:cyclic nucleotide-binding domain-containing protein [Synechococcus sp. BA-132 BA5]|uniref:cyclic nucleotide-binding domain-containing protein n=1 Tax=Synechococcus sp. BA-132 BA5 TaxID=3110252 RepID=UPI002B207C71|nr:cyclic nucleotide-binding domain-containing protein [Synechococcus sp. BA-132 BA5]MEA5413677.1 cyclic nucleotide-binding domain-containing protein [Synechococcus sp. BA-132 BA5]
MLITSLLLPGLNPLPGERPCEGADFCGGGPGNNLFWNLILPLVLLSIVVSHELWRRICPLSFVSQLCGALGLQRTRKGPGGKPHLVSVDPNSWLGKHHLQLQWCLLLAGLSVRLLVANSNGLALALLCLTALLGALVVGWAYAGKSWCQYFCPLGPVQAVITGPRGLLGSPAPMNARTRTTQSMCRTISPEGAEVSACVACSTPCIDIDAERAYWKNLSGKRGLQWAWTSYPGVVLSFYLLILATRPDQVDAYAYLHSGAFSFDTRLPALALQPIVSIGPLSIPRLIGIPLALAAGAALSSWLLEGVRGWLEGRLGEGDPVRRRAIATHRTRLLATVLAVNLFFFFKSNVFWFAGMPGERLIAFAVAAITAAWLWRGWWREEATYRRESTSESLRRQLARLPNLSQVLDNRRLEDLSALEIFTLAKAIPTLGLNQARDIYRGVMEDLLRKGRISRAESLLQLQELRQSLKLEDQDHHAVVRQLAEREPRLLEIDGLQRQRQDLREEVARESLQELMQVAGIEVLNPDTLSDSQRERLDQIRLSSGVNPAEWDSVLKVLGPDSPQLQERLRQRWGQLNRARELQVLLERHALGDPLLRPLARALKIRNQCLAEELEPRRHAVPLESPEDATLAPGSLAEALDLLWNDPDPDTAGWVLMVERTRFPDHVPQRLSHPRTGLAGSAFLEAMRRNGSCDAIAELPVLARCSLFEDLPPAGLLEVAAKGDVREWPQGSMLLKAGDRSEGLGVVIRGEALVQVSGREPIPVGQGKLLGEMGVITGDPRSADVIAGPGGLQLFWLSTEAFELLLHDSRGFTHGLLHQLVERLIAREKPLTPVAVG